jgi:hypothetical protein
MALVQGAWTVKSVNGRLVMTCTCGDDSNAIADCMTKITPKELDPTKPWSLIVTTKEDITAAGTGAVDIWGCTSANASLATADVGTECVLVHANSTDLDAGATCVIHVFPHGHVTQITNAALGIAVIPPYPYFIINYDTSTFQDAADIDFTIIQ